MGKQRRQRKKLHLEAPKLVESAAPPLNLDQIPTTSLFKPSESSQLVLQPSSNLFDGIKIDFSSLKTNLSVDDDLRSVKSFKSLKSEVEKNAPVLSKKEKLKLRRELFLKKIDIVNQARKQKELTQKKRKNVAIIGDTNPLHDALPSLESLLKNRSNRNIPYNASESEKNKAKGIEKSTKQKKAHLQGIKIFKNIMKNKQFQKDPMGAVSQHLKAFAEFDKNSTSSGSKNKK